MNLPSACLFVAFLLALPIRGQEHQPPPNKDENYIPADLQDAVRVLKGKIGKKDQEKIKKGEINAIGMHFGLGMSLRNSWGLWGGSRLAKYFNDNGIGHPDNMSGYILEAFCRDLRGEDYDLLQIMRDKAKEWPAFHAAIMEGGRMVEDRYQAILYSRLDYDDDQRIILTSLLWHPDDGKVYLTKGNAQRRLASSEVVAELLKDEEHALFSKKEIKILDRLREMTPDQRLELIRELDEAARKKIDGILPRTKDPEGLDHDVNVDPFAIDEAEAGSYDGTRPN